MLLVIFIVSGLILFPWNFQCEHIAQFIYTAKWHRIVYNMQRDTPTSSITEWIQVFGYYFLFVADACFELELRQVNYLSTIFYLKINCIHHHFRFYNMWIYPLSHSATKTIRVPCYHKIYLDFPSLLLAYSPLASPVRLPLMPSD